MENQYAKSMKSFFSTVDKDLFNRPSDLALAFANYFYTRNMGRYEKKVTLPKDSLNSVSILTRQTSLPFLTKRLPLLADTTVISHYGEERHIFSKMSNIPDNPDEPFVYAEAAVCSIGCPSMDELGLWLRDCKDLLISGDIFYFPDIEILSTYLERFYGIDGDTARDIRDENVTLGPLCELIVDNRKVVDTINGPTLKSQLVRSVLDIDLPYIENVDLKTFCKITADEKDAAQRFRDFLRTKFLDLSENEGSLQYEKNLAKISLEIKDGVRALDSDYKAISRKAAFQVTEAVIGAAAASLVAVNSIAFSQLPQLVGVTGGFLGIANAVHNYLEESQKSKDSPYFYFWLFRKTS